MDNECTLVECLFTQSCRSGSRFKGQHLTSDLFVEVRRTLPFLCEAFARGILSSLIAFNR